MSDVGRMITHSCGSYGSFRASLFEGVVVILDIDGDLPVWYLTPMKCSELSSSTKTPSESIAVLISTIEEKSVV